MSVFPTLCTLGNLTAGFAAIHYATKPVEFTMGPWEWSGLTFAAVLVFIGMFFDAIDGSVARLTRSTSELGAQLDSLADIVTFGVAPAFMTTMLVSHYLGGSGDVTIIGPAADNFYGRIVWAIAALYVCCAALRLARFNVETPDATAEGHMDFRGLPSPGAGGAVASLILLHQHMHVQLQGADELPLSFVRGAAFAVPFILLLCAFGMVSSLHYSHVINRYFRGRRSFRSIVWLVVPLILIVWFWQLVAAAVFCGYALSAPLRELWRRARRRGGAAATAE